jgi:hypothetical protein
VQIHVLQSVRGEWAACYVGAQNLIEVAEDFLSLGSLTRKEKIATLLHETGHAIWSFRARQRDQNDAEQGTASYLGRLNRYFGDKRKEATLEEEFFADDYARHCGFEQPLVSGLESLRNDYPDIFKPYPTTNRLDRIASGIEPELSILEAPSDF